MNKSIVLSDKPAITTTIPSLPPALLDQLIQELSTLASVYHTLPESFLGQGRFGAEAMQKAAIEYVTYAFTVMRCWLTCFQGTTPACTREPYRCGGSGSSGVGQQWPAAQQHREPTRHRL